MIVIATHKKNRVLIIQAPPSFCWNGNPNFCEGIPTNHRGYTKVHRHWVSTLISKFLTPKNRINWNDMTNVGILLPIWSTKFHTKHYHPNYFLDTSLTIVNVHPPFPEIYCPPQKSPPLGEEKVFVHRFSAIRLRIVNRCLSEPIWIAHEVR